jgi:acyl-CoA thioesterase
MVEIRPEFERDFTAAVGVRGLWFDGGRARCAIDVEQRHHNPGGILHGGVMFTIADAAMGAAVFSTLREGERTTGVEAQVRFLHPVVHGTLTAEGVVVHRGERIATTKAELTDSVGRLVAIATGTFYISLVSGTRGGPGHGGNVPDGKGR